MHEATSLERARSALSHLNPDSDRATWVKYGMCLKHEFGDAGFDIWDDWSSQSDKYNPRDARSTWKSIKADGKRTIASLFHDAKQAGWKDSSGVKKPTKAEIEARKAAAAERAAKAAELDAIAHDAASKRAQAKWDEAKPIDDDSHPYLQRKGVKSYGLRIGSWERTDPETGEVYTVTNNGLLIPIRDRQRRIWSLQCIFPEADKKKLYLKDGAKAGHFFALGSKPLQHEGRNVFCLGEGYATCASVHAATGHMVLCCFDVGNLLSVAQQLRERQPEAVILFLADNDTETAGNPGVTKAGEAAAAVGGLVAVPPPGDFNDLQAAEGLEAVSGVVAAALDAKEQAETPPWEPEPDVGPEASEDATQAPAQPALPPADVEDGEYTVPTAHFTVLGYDMDDFWVFHHEKKQVVRRTRGDFGSDQGLVDLAPLDWWESYFPGARTGIDRTRAYEWFIRLAHKRGIYDPKRVRGRGAWRDNGRVVFHHGDHLSVDGVSTEIAGIESRWVYPMSKSMPALSVTPVSDAEGQYLLDVAKMARWSRPGSAALLAGWVFLGPVCGALSWRPHIWITGAAGSGKSTLFESYAQALLDGISEPLAGDSTEPGIRQSVRADAVPILIDEFEPNDEADRKRMKSILTTARQSSSETSAQTAKGTISGDGMRFHVRSMFCFASINTMLDKDSDASRITPLVMRPPAKTGSSDDQWQALEEELHKIKRAGSWPARLLARSLGMLPVILANVEVFIRAAAQRFGTQRHGDQYGTLLAGAWSLTRSNVATDAEAMAMIDSYDWTEHTEISGGPADPEKALAAIMESKIRVLNTDVTVFEIVSEACGHPSSSTQIGGQACVDILRRNGIRIEGDSLLFGVNTGTLRSLVKDTAYVTDLRGQLSRLPGASNMGNRTRKFAGVNSKLIGVPLKLVIDDLDESPI